MQRYEVYIVVLRATRFALYVSGRWFPRLFVSATSLMVVVVVAALYPAIAADTRYAI